MSQQRRQLLEMLLNGEITAAEVKVLMKFPANFVPMTWLDPGEQITPDAQYDIIDLDTGQTTGQVTARELMEAFPEMKEQEIDWRT